MRSAAHLQQIANGLIIAGRLVPVKLEQIGLCPMFYLKKILEALLLPPLGPVILMACGLLLVGRRRKIGTLLAVIGLMSLAALSVPVVANALLRAQEGVAPLGFDRLDTAQAIVVLGGGTNYSAPEYGGDTVNAQSLQRLRYAATLQRRSGLPLLVSGGAPFSGRPEALSMQAVLEREFAVKVRWAETASRDTAENASLSAPLLRDNGIQRIVLVSHAWHLPRAVAAFERQGFTVIPAPTGFTRDSPSLLENLLPSAFALEKSRSALNEWLGRLLAPL
jgi:uncharacterized SAM-binding protein YcdF (DUF218 family)